MEIPCPSKEDRSVERRFFSELRFHCARVTVASRDEVKSWGLDRTTFKSILQETEDKKIMLYSTSSNRQANLQARMIGKLDIAKNYN
ncbi:cAMP-dependent protein kinase regulator [Aureococcus anophagefferens]|nr:cAMP-dependent protein kinase regulator [Aureococcus anophagefferens]